MIGQSAGVIVVEALGAAATLGGAYAIIQMTARFKVDLADRYRIEVDRLRVLLDESETELTGLVDKHRAELDRFRDLLRKCEAEYARLSARTRKP